MDSIVDSFFPLVEQVEKEMMHLENVMFSECIIPASEPDTSTENRRAEETVKPSSGSETVVSHSGSFEKDNKNFSPDLSEKITTSVLHTQFSIPKRRFLTIRHAKVLLRQAFRRFPRLNFKVKQAPQGEHATHQTVHRVARARRLVTSLSRILASKSEVVAQVKKRLLMVGESGLAHGTGNDHDVYTYLGDVQGEVNLLSCRSFTDGLL